MSGRISSRSTSVTPKIPAKVSLHNSADLHNDTASSGSHVLDQTQSTVHYGNDETVDIHSESSVSGSRSLNSPKLDRIQSQDEDIPREEVVEFIREAGDEGDAMVVSAETQDQGACNIFTNILTTNLDDVVVNESYNINIIDTAHASSANQNVNDIDDSASHEEYTSHEYASHDENLSHDDSLSHDDTSHDETFSQTSQASYHLDSCDTDQSYDHSNSVSLPSELRFSSLDQSDSLSLPSDVKGSDSLHSGLSDDDLLEGERLYLQSISNIGDGDVDSFVDNIVEPLLFEAQTKSLHTTAKNVEALGSTSETCIISEETKVADDEGMTDLGDSRKGKVNNVSVDVSPVCRNDNVTENDSIRDFQEVSESYPVCLDKESKDVKTDEIPFSPKPKAYDPEENDFPFIDDEQDELEPSSCILATVESDNENVKKLPEEVKNVTDIDISCLPNGTAVVYSAEIPETASAIKNADIESDENIVIDKHKMNTEETIAAEITDDFEDVNDSDMFDDIPYYLHRRLIEGDIRGKKETELYTALANVLGTSDFFTQLRPGRSLKRPQNVKVQQLKADEIPYQPPPNSANKRTPSASPGRSPGRLSPGGLSLDFSSEGRRSRTSSRSSHSRSPSGGRNRMEVINYHKLPKKDNFSSVDDTSNSPTEGDILPFSKQKHSTVAKKGPHSKVDTAVNSVVEEKKKISGSKEIDVGNVKEKNNADIKERHAAKIVKQDSVISEGSVNVSDINIGDKIMDLSNESPSEQHKLFSACGPKRNDKSKRRSSAFDTKEFTPKSILNRKSLARRRFSEGAAIYTQTVDETDIDFKPETGEQVPTYFPVELGMKTIQESNIGALATDSLTRQSCALRKNKPKLSELNTKGKSYEEQEWENLIQKLRKEDDSSPVDLQPSDLLRPLDETVRKKGSHDSRNESRVKVHDYYYDPEPSYTAASILLSQSYYQNYTTHHDCVDSNFSTFKSTPSASPMGSRSSTSLSSLGDSSGAITVSLSHDTEDIQMEEKSIVDYAFGILETDIDNSAAQHHAVIRRSLSPCRLKEYTTQSCKEVRVCNDSDNSDDLDLMPKRHSYHGETSERALNKQKRKLSEPKRVSFHETVEEIQSEPYHSSSSSDEKQSDKDSPDLPASSDSNNRLKSETGDNLSQSFEEKLDSSEFVEISLTRDEEDSDGSRGSGSRSGRSGSESDDESECSDGGDLDKTNEFLKFARSLAESGKESTADSGVGDSMTNTTEPSPSESLKKLENLQESHTQEDINGDELKSSTEHGLKKLEHLQEKEGINSDKLKSSTEHGQSYEDISSSSSSNSDEVAPETNKRPSIDPLESLEQFHDSYVSSDEESFEGETMPTD